MTNQYYIFSVFRLFWNDNCFIPSSLDCFQDNKKQGGGSGACSRGAATAGGTCSGRGSAANNLSVYRSAWERRRGKLKELDLAHYDSPPLPRLGQRSSTENATIHWLHSPSKCHIIAEWFRSPGRQHDSGIACMTWNSPPWFSDTNNKANFSRLFDRL